MGLGKLLDEYRYNHRPLLIVCGLFAVAGLAGAATAGDQWPAVLGATGGLIAFSLAVAFFGPARRAVDEHEHGLVVRNGSKVAQVRWSEVFGVTGELSGPRTEGLIDAPRFAKLTLHTDRGEQHGFGLGLVGYATLAERTLARVRRRFLEAARAARTGGPPVLLGEARVEKDALVVGRKRVPWGEISSVELEGDHLVVLRQGKVFARAPLTRVPNAMFLHEVAKLRV